LALRFLRGFRLGALALKVLTGALFFRFAL
jgi:hypothetical protein